MTAYSFGARWVGVVALREPPPPEPLHKMALRLRQASYSRAIRIDGIDIAADELLRVLSSIRFRLGLAGQEARARECLQVEQSIRAGRTPSMRSWLRTRIADAAGRTTEVEPDSVSAAHAPPSDLRLKRPERIVATGWATAYPQAVDSPWLPPLPEAFADEIDRLGFQKDDDALLWLRWACLHSSYLYESVPDSPVSAGVLEILAMLGRGWMRIAILDRARFQRGEFASNNEVSAVLATDQQVRTALGEWAKTLGAGTYGKGEGALLAAGSRSTAPESVAMQILGALSLVTASQSSADAVLESIDYRVPTPEPDWLNVLVSELKVQPQFERTDEGPDHNKTITVTVRAVGRTASAVAGSAKAARKEALREYVTRYLPRAVPRPASVAIPPRPRVYPASLPRHMEAVEWAQNAFEVADGGLMAQALTHRSWVYENSSLVSAAGQRDYGTLATEGSEILTHLVRHQHALQLLNASFQQPTGLVTTPHVTRDAVAELFGRMPIAGGVLRSRGLARDSDLSPDIREDVAQAVVGAAWRANGDLLAERQTEVLARWIHGFTPAADPTTQIQEYCARAKVHFEFEFEQRGRDHAAEFRAILTFEVDGRPEWRGDWCNGKTPAKHSAAAGALDYLLNDSQHSHDNGDRHGDAIVRGLLLAELRAVDPDHVNPQRELTNGTLGVDLLASADYAAFDAWSKPRSALLSTTGSAVASRLTQFYEAVLTSQRRDGFSKWIVGHTPARGGQSDDPAARIRDWWSGTDPGLLVLLDDLMPRLRNADPAAAIVDFIDAQARAIASAAGVGIETERTEDSSAHRLTIRLEGADLSRAIDPVVRLVEFAGVGATWGREPHAISVEIPTIPNVGDLLSVAAFDAVKNALNDRWLNKVHSALSAFLAITERVFGADVEPSPARMDELSLAELTLILQLRSDDEDD